MFPLNAFSDRGAEILGVFEREQRLRGSAPLRVASIQALRTPENRLATARYGTAKLGLPGRRAFTTHQHLEFALVVRCAAAKYNAKHKAQHLSLHR